MSTSAGQDTTIPESAAPQAASGNLRGIVAMTLASLMFSCNDAFIKLVARDLPMGEILALRNGAAGLLLIGYAIATGTLLPWRLRPEPAVVVRTLGEIGITASYMYALFRIPIGLAASILQFGPLAITAGAALFFGERVGWRRWTATSIGLIGVLIMIGPGAEGLGPAASLAFVGLLFMTVRELATRRIAADVPTAQIALTSIAAVVVFAFALMPFESWQAPALWHLVYLGAAAVLVVAAFLLIIAAMRLGEASVVAPFRYAYAVGSISTGYLVWNDVPSAAALAGLAIVVGSGLYVLSLEWPAKTASGAARDTQAPAAAAADPTDGGAAPRAALAPAARRSDPAP